MRGGLTIGSIESRGNRYLCRVEASHPYPPTLLVHLIGSHPPALGRESERPATRATWQAGRAKKAKRQSCGCLDSRLCALPYDHIHGHSMSRVSLWMAMPLAH
jgi:hypothetical protein